MTLSKPSKAIASIKKQIQEGKILFVSWSGGKDSSVILDLTLKAALEYRNETGRSTLVVVTHADTLVENPEMDLYTRREMQKIRDFASLHGLNVKVLSSTPYLNSTWAVKVISGRHMPVFAMTKQRSCTVDMKIKPMAILKKKILDLPNLKGIDHVTVVGTRFDESASRAKRMESREETDDRPWGNDGEMMLSPIAYWETKDIWDYLRDPITNSQVSLFPDDLGECFSNFQDLLRLYEDGSSDGKLSCRYGCSVCTVGRDKSMENLITNDPDRYSYMQPLLDLQRFLVNTQHDLSRRSWIGRTIDKNGYITITPDVYSPQMLADLLRYCLSIDKQEQLRAQEKGESPKFKLLTLDAVLAIDAIWSLQGNQRPFTALKIWDEIMEREEGFYPVPSVDPIPKMEIPPKKYLYVGEDWKESHQYKYAGLRDVMLESFAGECVGTKLLKNGDTVIDVHTDLSFGFDDDALELFWGVEFPELMERIKAGEYDNAPYTDGYKYYVRLGIMQLAKGREWQANDILRRTSIKEALGLLGPDVNYSEIYDLAVDAKAMKEALGSHDEIEEPQEEIVEEQEEPGFQKIRL